MGSDDTTNLEQARAALWRAFYGHEVASLAKQGPAPDLFAAVESLIAAAQEDAKAEVARLRTALQAIVAYDELGAGTQEYLASFPHGTFATPVEIARRALAGEGQ